MSEDVKTLEVLFAHERDVTLEGGAVVKMRPLPLPYITDLVRGFSAIIQKMHGSIVKATDPNAPAEPDAEMVISVAEIAEALTDDIVRLLPHCINVPLESLPVTAAPDLVEAFVEMNITDAFIKKWTALFGQLRGLIG